MAHYLDPKTDVVFKKIFGDRADLLKSFLNAVLPLPEDGLIESLEYLPPEQVPVIPSFKNSIVDVKCKDSLGRIFIVEMQIQWTDSFMERLLFGTSQAYVRQLKKGDDYKLLNPVYGLGILAGIFDKETPKWYHHYRIVNIENTEREIKGLQLVFVELPKFKINSYTEKKLQILWLRFLAEIDDNCRYIQPDLLEVPEIREAAAIAEEAGFTESELAAYDKYWDCVSVEKSLLSGSFDSGYNEGKTLGVEAGLKEGLKEGEKIGIEKGQQVEKLRIAKKLLDSGLSLKQTSEITQLSMEILQNLEIHKELA